jgi:hypothetical protein
MALGGETLTLRWWKTSTIIAGIAGAAAYLLQIIVSETLPPWAHWSLTGVGTILLAASIVLPIMRANANDRERKTALELAREAVAAYDRRMHGVLIPLSGMLAELLASPTAKSRENQQAQIKQAIIGYALDIISGTSPRSCFFELVDGDPRKLSCTTLWKGRTRAPRPEFVDGQLAGSEAFRVLDGRTTKYVQKADEFNSPGMPVGRDYETYIQAPVYNGDSSFGLLTVDAPHAGDFDDGDRRLVELLAQLLGCALAVK